RTVVAAAPREIATCFATGRPRAFCRQLDAGATRFRETDRNRLFRASRTMFSFADVVNCFADILAGLGGRRFALARFPARPLSGGFLWHGVSLVKRRPAFFARAGVVSPWGPRPA